MQLPRDPTSPRAASDSARGCAAGGAAITRVIGRDRARSGEIGRHWERSAYQHIREMREYWVDLSRLRASPPYNGIGPKRGKLVAGVKTHHGMEEHQWWRVLLPLAPGERPA